MKRVGINATLLGPRAGGIGVYMQQLLEGLPLTNETWQPCFFLTPEVKNQHTDTSDERFVSFNFSSKNPLLRIPLEALAWRGVLAKQKIDLFHSPISYIPPGVSGPAVVTVHDLRYFHYPETYTRLRGKFLEKMIPRSLERAQRIIAVSESTKQDMIDLFGIDSEKIRVIHEGIHAETFQQPILEQTAQRVRKAYDLPVDYLLAVGHLEPRKNYELLFEAVRLLKDEHGITQHVVIVGQENWKFESIYERVKLLNLEHHIHFTGFVADDDLPAVYQMASVFVAPSLFEGFGFTPLEAMAAGVPTVVSNCTSHPEVCGDAALYFGPLDRNDLAQTLATVLNDNDLCSRLIERGHNRIKQFSWQTCCQQTADVYLECLKT